MRLLNYCKRLKNKVCGQKYRKIKTDITIPLKHFGGNACDAGDISIGSFENKEDIIIYVAGVGEEVNFELDLLKELSGRNVQIYAFDPTPKTADFIKNANLPENFHFYPFAIVDNDRDVEFALPQEDGWISGSCEDVKDDSRRFDFDNKLVVEGRSISSIMQQLGHKSIDLLKIDIEGSEFVALNDVFDKQLDIKQIALDYHDYMFVDGNEKMESLLSKIKASDYKIYYVERDVNKNQNMGLIKK